MALSTGNCSNPTFDRSLDATNVLRWAELVGIIEIRADGSWKLTEVGRSQAKNLKPLALVAPKLRA